jgi:hypothetical protein
MTLVGEESTYEWSIVIYIKNDENEYFVIMGESTNAEDGTQADAYDAPHSPFPPPPYLQAYFDDGLSAPYNQLSQDWRHYCDGIDKTWNLTVAVNGLGSQFELSWESADFVTSEYGSFYLRDATNGLILADMLLTSNYVETITMDPGYYNYHITCENASCEDDDGGNNGGNGGSTPPPINLPPIANIFVSGVHANVGESIFFNGSSSEDEDGEITNYSWDFNDGSKSYEMFTDHKFSKTGTFNVSLTVTDDEGATDVDSVKIIIGASNYPPSKPIIDGIKFGDINVDYTYTITSIDKDNDKINYLIEWGDNESDSSGFIDNGTVFEKSHRWTYPGVYKINVRVTDNKTYSDLAKFLVLIDAKFVEDLGYLLDFDNDNLYDGFYSNMTNMENEVELLNNNSTYLIDYNGNGKWDYSYNIQADILESYKKTEDKSKNINTTFIVFVVLIILILILIIYFVFKK